MQDGLAGHDYDLPDERLDERPALGQFAPIQEVVHLSSVFRNFDGVAQS